MVAPGMIKKVSVQIQSNENDFGSIKEELQIVTKNDIFKIPVEATILTASNYEQANRES